MAIVDQMLIGFVDHAIECGNGANIIYLHRTGGEQAHCAIVDIKTLNELLTGDPGPQRLDEIANNHDHVEGDDPGWWPT